MGESGWTRERDIEFVCGCKLEDFPGVLGMWDDLTLVFMNEWREMTLSANALTFGVLP